MEIKFTGKPRVTLVLFSHLGITESDMAKKEIAEKIAEKYTILNLMTVEIEGGKTEYCFVMNEFPAQVAWKLDQGIIDGIDIMMMATDEFFEEVNKI